MQLLLPQGLNEHILELIATTLSSHPIWYFVFGDSSKTSFTSQYATQHKIKHLKNPSHKELEENQNCDLMIETDSQTFRKVEHLSVNFMVVVVGKQTDKQICKIMKEYCCVGKCKWVKELSYNCFRKTMYPKIVFVYGPDKTQNANIMNYFFNTGSEMINQTLSVNHIIKNCDKAENYVICGLIPCEKEIKILEEYFNFWIVHVKNDRNQIKNEEFFDKENKFIPAIKDKPYLISINGGQHRVQMVHQLGEKLLPKLIYANIQDQNERGKLNDHVNQNNILMLSILEVQAVLKKKKLRINPSVQDKTQFLVDMVFKNLDQKEIYFTDYPFSVVEFKHLENRTKPFSLFLDSLNLKDYDLEKQYSAQIYFLENQKRKRINSDFCYGKQLVEPKKYFIVSGAAGCGKTSASKYIGTEYCYKTIQYEPYVASIKEKLITPEDGEELPLAKIIKHFGDMICSSQEIVLIDGLNIDAKDIQKWAKGVGFPNIINLKLEEKQLTKRTRKKAEADLNAQVSEEEAAKIKEAITKNSEWIDCFTNTCPEATIYNIDFTPQLLLAEKLLDSVLKPRLYLVQQNMTGLFQNIAIKNDMGFYNIRESSLKQIQKMVKSKCQRDIILNNYGQIGSQLICDDMYWIERHIGSVRYLGVWKDEEKKKEDEQLKLEKPVVEQKPKPAEGEEQPPAEQPNEEQGEGKKKALDIYKFTWTKPTTHHNLSQWYFRSKKCIEQKETKMKDCFSSFSQLVEKINDNKDICFYEKIQ